MTTRGPRFVLEDQAGLVGGAATLFGVTATTTGDDVLPGMGSTLGLWDDVIDVLRRPAAVLTPVGVTQEHRPAVQGDPARIRDLDELAETDHRW